MPGGWGSSFAHSLGKQASAKCVSGPATFSSVLLTTASLSAMEALYHLALWLAAGLQFLWFGVAWAGQEKLEEERCLAS